MMNLAASGPWTAPFDTGSQATFSNFDQWTITIGTLKEVLLKTTFADGSFSSTVKKTGVQSGVTYSNVLVYSATGTGIWGK